MIEYNVHRAQNRSSKEVTLAHILVSSRTSFEHTYKKRNVQTLNRQREELEKFYKYM